MNKSLYLADEQSQDISTDLEHTIAVDTIDDAADWFVVAKDKLLDVNAWHRISTTPSATFLLTDSHGKPHHRKAHKGDHIHIVTKGDGHRYKWGIIYAITYDDYPDEDVESFALHVRLSTTDTVELSKSTIIVERRGCELSAIYKGENSVHALNNVKENNQQNLPDIQWSGLIDGILTES